MHAPGARCPEVYGTAALRPCGEGRRACDAVAVAVAVVRPRSRPPGPTDARRPAPAARGPRVECRVPRAGAPWLPRRVPAEPRRSWSCSWSWFWFLPVPLPCACPRSLSYRGSRSVRASRGSPEAPAPRASGPGPWGPIGLDKRRSCIIVRGTHPQARRSKRQRLCRVSEPRGGMGEAGRRAQRGNSPPRPGTCRTGTERRARGRPCPSQPAATNLHARRSDGGARARARTRAARGLRRRRRRR